jgi:hypothetical protein
VALRSHLLFCCVALGSPLVIAACNALLGNEAGYVAEAASDDEGVAERQLPDVPGTSDVSSGGDAFSDAAPASDLLGDADAAEEDAAPPFDPTSFGATVVLWLKGDVGVTTSPCAAGSCVTSWADQSTWGNHATLPDAATPPGIATVAGHQAVSFDDVDGGVDMWLRIADAPSLQLRSFTIVAVASNSPASRTHVHFGVLFAKSVPSTYPFPGPGLLLNCANDQLPAATGQTCIQVDIVDYAATAERDLFDGNVRAYVAVYDPLETPTTLSLGVNAEMWATAVLPEAGGVQAVGQPARIGGGGARQTMTGDLLELMVLDVPLSSAQWGPVYGYLRGKYGLP